MGLALYGLYEIALPPVDMSGRMGIILPLLFFLCVNGMIKVTVLVYLLGRSGGSRRRLHDLPQRSFQFLFALPVAAACTAWYWFWLR